ncbi:hypothetical protein ACHAPK_008813 [Fusarium culmorum]
MPQSSFCAKCTGIFEGHYVPSDVLAQHGLIDTVAARFISQNLDKLGGTIGKARLDKASEKETPVPYLHHNLQDLEESADTCVFCAMIWERLTIEGFLYDSTILDEMKKKDLVGIPVIQSKVAFTATFQDAIKLANDIGIEYVWIDSLCIIQDSKDDWQTEAARMSSVYSQSYVTIAATAAQDSAAGLKDQNSMLRYPCEITPSWTGFEDEIPSGPVRIIIRSGFCDEVLSKPLFRRGWTFQEWILSPRTIHVARDQLWWTSATNMKSQGHAANETCEAYEFDVDRDHVHTMTPGDLYSLANESTGTSSRVWHDLLQEYTSRDLTFESDRLVAFAGIAALYQNFAKLPPGSYLAGLWRQVLLEDLLWSVLDGRKVLPPQLYRGPSWSWASVEPTPNQNGRFSVGMKDIGFNLLPHEEPWTAVATVREAFVEAIGSEFGPVSGGHLVFHGPLIKARHGLVVIDLSDRLTAEQAAKFVPGGKLRYTRSYVSMPNQTDAAAKARAEGKITMVHLDAVPTSLVSDEEIDIYLAVTHCRIDLAGDPTAHVLALVRGLEKGEYRRIGYAQLFEAIMDPWKETKDFGVFGALTDENEYLSVGDRPGYYNYRIV